MTNKEAKEQLTIFQGTYEPPSYEAVSEAIKALERQIPKKPVYIREHDVIYFDWKCPNCNREYVNSAYGIPHCVDCGQKIDWEE